MVVDLIPGIGIIVARAARALNIEYVACSANNPRATSISTGLANETCAMISRKGGDCYDRRVAALVGYHFDDVLVHTVEPDAASAQPANTAPDSE